MRALLACALVAAAAAARHVVELTPDNFDALVGNGDDWMVEVYAPWCGHCKRLEPHYEAAAAQLAGSVRFGKVDGSKYRSLSVRFGIKGFPTIFHVHGATGEVRRAAVNHNPESLVHYATKGWAARAYEPMGFWESPNGPLKRTVFEGMRLGEKVVHLHEPIADYLGVPPPLVLFCFCLLALVSLSALLVGCALCIGPGPEAKARAAAAHAHAD